MYFVFVLFYVYLCVFVIMCVCVCVCVCVCDLCAREISWCAERQAVLLKETLVLREVTPVSRVNRWCADQGKYSVTLVCGENAGAAGSVLGALGPFLTL